MQLSENKQLVFSRNFCGCPVPNASFDSLGLQFLLHLPTEKATMESVKFSSGTAYRIDIERY